MTSSQEGESNFQKALKSFQKSDSLHSINSNNSLNKRDSSSDNDSVNDSADSALHVNEDKLTNYNGIIEEDDTATGTLYGGYNFTSTMELRKNLVGAFENVSDAEGPPQENEGVKAKIRAFEDNATTAKNGRHVRFETTTTKIEKPPLVPTLPPAISRKPHDSSTSKLNVYLRIRPPSVDSSSRTDAAEEEALNTVEIVQADSNPRDKSSASIRTYPPIKSNAAKLVRGQHHLHTTSHNTDLIFSNITDNLHSSSSDSNKIINKGVRQYEFNSIFDPQSSQEDVYEGIASPMVDSLFPEDDVRLVGDNIVGKSALLFSYGITNAGKTYTIMGDSNRSEDILPNHGIIPRAIHHVLSKIKTFDDSSKTISGERVKYNLYMSYLEIYNEQIFDLLPKKDKQVQTKPQYPQSFDDHTSLKIREGRNGRIHVRGLAKHRVDSFSEGLDLVEQAKFKRHTSSNNINRDSSRSHCICQLELFASFGNRDEYDGASAGTDASMYSNDDDSVASNDSKPKSVTMWIVDLAGSERAKRTGAYSKSTRQKEAALINSSLMKLMRCLQALQGNQGSNTVLPFRESKLTHLFMGHFTGASSSKTSMIININPCVADFDETQHVLSYATVARSVRIDEEEFIRKRRAIQMGTHTHDQDGKPMRKNSKKTESKSPPKKIARLCKKLSPRTILAKRRQQVAEAERKRKAEMENIRGIETVSSEETTEPAVKKSKFLGSNKKLEEENKELRININERDTEISKLTEEMVEAKLKLVHHERHIRLELAEETERQMRMMRDHYEEIIGHLQQERLAVPTPSLSAKKIQHDKAEAMVDELMDRIDECEDEMKREREIHSAEISELRIQLESELQSKQKEISKLVAAHAKEKVGLQSRIEELLKERDDLKERCDSLLEELENAENNNDDDSDSDDSVSTVTLDPGFKKTDNKENTSSQTPQSSQLWRLPRGRCSEVACANLSPTNNAKDVTSSSKKKKTLRLMGNKKPLTTLSSSADNESNNDVDVLFPNRKSEIDENTGKFIRPRGRAPIGRTWDGKLGGWKLRTPTH